MRTFADLMRCTSAIWDSCAGVFTHEITFSHSPGLPALVKHRAQQVRHRPLHRRTDMLVDVLRGGYTGVPERDADDLAVNDLLQEQWRHCMAEAVRVGLCVREYSLPMWSPGDFCT